MSKNLKKMISYYKPYLGVFCNQVVITRRSGIKGRIKVLLIGESFGY